MALSADVGTLTLDPFEAKDFYRTIIDHLPEGVERMPMLFVPAVPPVEQKDGTIHLTKELAKSTSGYCFPFTYANDEQMDYALSKHIRSILWLALERFMLFHGAGEDFADNGSINEIAREVQARIDQLYAMGVSEYVISRIVKLPKPKPSRMVITEDFRIVLTDYDGMEIAMPTLSKVLYFFYLRHPEGMLFKQL